MSTLAPTEMEGRYARAVAEQPPLHPLPQPRWLRAVRSWQRRQLIECATGVAAGAVIAVGCAALAPAGSNLRARHERLEREMANLSAPLAEYARLERAEQGALASAAAAAVRARPAADLRLLLGTLSAQAHAGVTVRRLRQNREEFEMQVRAVDSAACASWVARLARVPGWEGTDMVDLRWVATLKGSQAERTVEANVRVRPHVAASASGSVTAGAPTGAGEFGGGRGR